MSDPMTCIHQSKGLCPTCQAEFEEDEDAWLEFGAHPEGLARWEALQAEMAEEWQAQQASDERRLVEEAQDPTPRATWDDIPF